MGLWPSFTNLEYHTSSDEVHLESAHGSIMHVQKLAIWMQLTEEELHQTNLPRVNDFSIRVKAFSNDRDIHLDDFLTELGGQLNALRG